MEMTFVCPDCNGKGFVFDHLPQFPCDECDGSGKIPLKSRKENTENVVGKASEALVKRMKELRRAADTLERELEIEKLKMEDQLKQIFEERFDTIEDQKMALWVEIENELGIGHDSVYKLNTVTGIVTRED